jgi:hypothetical protein
VLWRGRGKKDPPRKRQDEELQRVYRRTERDVRPLIERRPPRRRRDAA